MRRTQKGKWTNGDLVGLKNLVGGHYEKRDKTEVIE
jgi:hypothetical protein